jgi:hypothetical protein
MCSCVCYVVYSEEIKNKYVLVIHNNLIWRTLLWIFVLGICGCSIDEI